MVMIPEIARQLQRERDKVKVDLRRLEREMIRKKQELKRLTAAIKVLGGKVASRHNVTAEQIIAMIESNLRDGHGRTTEQIKRLVEEGGEGVPKDILKRRLEEALRNNRFRLQDGMWFLHSPGSAD